VPDHLAGHGVSALGGGGFVRKVKKFEKIVKIWLTSEAWKVYIGAFFFAL
jgi:hypothetical protein